MKTNYKKWKRVSSECIFNTRCIKLIKDVVVLPNGKRYNYYLTNRNRKCVFILPFDSRGRMMLVKEFRYPINKLIYGNVAGWVERKESPLTAAKRELKEETGYSAKNFKLLGRYYSSPSNNDTRFYIYTATGLKKRSA